MTFFALENPTYGPAMRLISNITNGNPASVTTTFNHGYITGMIVRLNVPRNFGMYEVNQLYAPITVTGNTTFTIELDTTRMSSYNAPVQMYERHTSYVTPIGEVNAILTAATKNLL